MATTTTRQLTQPERDGILKHLEWLTQLERKHGPVYRMRAERLRREGMERRQA